MIITKEKEEKDANKSKGKKAEIRDQAFPKLILEDDKGKDDEEDVIDQEKKISFREILFFFMFVIFFIIVTYFQLNIDNSYATNYYIRTSLLEASQDNLDVDPNFISFENINVEDSYWRWLNQLIYTAYNDRYYNDFAIPESKQKAVPNLNIFVSPLRITQRRMKLKNNTDPYQSRIVPDGWASYGFDYLSDFDSSQEDNAPFGKTQVLKKYGFTNFNYTSELSFYKKGGYVWGIDLQNTTQDNCFKQLKMLKDGGFIDSQTRSIVVDMVMFNPYTDMFTMVTFVAIFEANGLLSNRLELYNLKWRYYQGVTGFSRGIFEVAFIFLLLFYWLLELSYIFEQIKQQKKAHEKHAIKMKLLAKRQKSSSQSESEIKQDQNEKNESSFIPKIINYFTFVVNGLKEHYSDGWKWIDSAIIGISTISILLWLSIIYLHMTQVTALNLADLHDLSKNEPFFTISFKMQVYIHLSAFNYVLLFVKFLRYLSFFIKKTRIIFRTLSAAKEDIFSFMILYVIIFVAFSVMCHIYYGAELPQFASLPISCASLFVMLMGDLSTLEDMTKMNETLSFYVFIAFIASMQFILMNMFIAFISYSYTEGISVNDEVQESLDDELKRRHWSVILVQKYRFLISFIKRTVLSRNNSSQQDNKNKPNGGDNQDIRKATYNSLQKTKNSQNNDKFEEEEIKEDNNQLKRETNLFGPINEKPKKESKGQNSSINQSIISHSDINLQDLSQPNQHNLVDQQNEQLEIDKNKPLLMRKIWDKQFDNNMFYSDEPAWAPSLVSEQQEEEIKKEKEVKCGRILWAGLGYTLYTVMYIAIIIMQIQVDIFHPYNQSLEQNILDLELSGGRTIVSAQNYADMVYWLQNQFPKLGQNKTLLKTSKKSVQGFYIRDVNYVLNHQFRLCFILSKETGYKNKTSENEFFKDTNTDHQMRNDFIGEKSNKTYKYSKDFEGYQLSGSYCTIMRFFPQSQYYQNDTTLQDFIDDHIISDRMMQMSIEFITFEASQYVHSFNTIQFVFPDNGGIEIEIEIFAMSLNNYMNNQDYFRLALEIIYLLLLINNFFTFIRKIKDSNNQYNLWYQMEVANLSDIEIKQRNLIMPEFFRKMSTIIDAFTIIDMIYMLLTFTSVTIWIIYNQAAYSADITNTPITDANNANDLIQVGEIPPYVHAKNFYPQFYFLAALMKIHTNIAAINTVFISLRVFDFINKTQSVKILSNTLVGAREYIMYFIIIFLVLIFGFVGMSYLSFGSRFGGYDTLKSSLRMNFQLTLGEFDFEKLYRANPTMTFFYFFSFNFLFIFILRNIFLAIINQTYSESLRQELELQYAQGGRQDDDVDMMSAFFYCFKLKRNKKKDNAGEETKRSSLDKDPNANAGVGNDYLEIFDKLTLNLQQANQNASERQSISGFADLKTWAINSADEIKTELKVRSQLRQKARNIAMLVFNKNGGGGKEADKSGAAGDPSDGQDGTTVAQVIDDHEVIQKRIQYWDYLRNGTQFISIQNRTLQAMITEKEALIREKAQEFETEKEKTRDMYKYLALLEKPIEDKLEQILNFRKVLSLLNQEYQILNDQLKLIHQEKTSIAQFNKNGMRDAPRETNHSDRRRQRSSRNRINSNSEKGLNMLSQSNANFTQKQNKLSHFI